MKKTILHNSSKNLFLPLFCLSLTLGIAAQDTSRTRVITAPTPTISPIPKVSPTVTPTVSPTASPTPAAVQTLPELQTKIRTILARPTLMRGRVGVKVVSLDTNKVVFEDNAEKYFMPASNMKSFTVAAAMDRLSPTFRFVTSVYAFSKPDANGTLRGDLIIYGRGDPSFSNAFTNPDATAPPTESDYLASVNALADKIVQAGVKKVEGNLIGDESYFNTNGVPGSWETDDLQWYYGAEVSALTINDNALDLSIQPSSVGAPALIQFLPANNLMTIVNRITTSAAGTKRNLQVVKKLGQNIVEIYGTIPVGDNYRGRLAVSRPAMLFTTLLRRVLEQKGVTVTGQTRVVDARDRNFQPSIPPTPTVSTVPTSTASPSPMPSASAPPSAAAAPSQIELTRLESPIFSIIAAKTMKPSQNLYTELILRVLGEQAGDKSDPRKTSEQRGIEVVQNFLAQAGVSAGSVIQEDGSGLSRHNLITPAATAQLFAYMNSRPYAAAWRESLTVAGVDGTLRNRFAGTPAAANVRGKTGTIAQVSSLSGYLTTAAGERLAFSVLTNGIPETRLRTATIDEIVLLLTNFNGKIN